MNLVQESTAVSLRQAFERNVSACADKDAILEEVAKISWRDLAAVVSAIENCLRTAGLGGAMVGLMMPGSIAYVASVLAVTGVRGVFAPMDETWPDNRIKATLRLARPPALIVTSSQVARARALLTASEVSCLLLVLDPENLLAGPQVEREQVWAPGAPPVINAPDQPWQADSLYLVFTSGSTGTPNAVEGCHGSLAQFIQWQQQTYGVTGSCRVAQLAPTTFDVSLRDIFLPLSAGGTMCIPRAGTKYHPVLLCKWIEKFQVNLMHSVPSLFKFVVDMTQGQPKLARAFDSLEKLFLSGERLYVADAMTIYTRLSQEAEVINFYGPSESTLIKSHFVLPRAMAADCPQVAPLGRAIAGASLHVRSEGQECAPGVNGEIVLRSPYLAKGYFGNPALTDSKFAVLDATQTPALREYRTGDLGYMDQDGLLHFVGRMDDQIKLNGNRIEIGDVEQCIRKMPQIKDAVVAACTLPSGELQLGCVYISGEPSLDEDQIHSYMSQNLPAYMVFSRMVAVEEFPLMANGKVDRQRIRDLLLSIAQ